MIRAFIAIEIPYYIKEQISEIDKIILDTDARLNIVNPDISHITLKFIGDIDESEIEDIKQFLQKIKYNRYEIDMRGVSLNSIKSPRVVWINGYDNNRSSALRDIIEDGLASFGIEKEMRPYKAHTTIARIKKYHPSLKPVIKSLSDKNLGKFEVSGFKLKKSTLTPEGPLYEDIMEVSF